MNPLPQHRKLYELLRKQIVDGVYHEGDLLPSENELCALHNLTRPTVRHALDALLNEGFITKRQGKGSIVNMLPKGVGILSIAGTSTALGSKNQKASIIVKPRLKTWDDPFFFRLSAAELQNGCIYMERIRFFNEAPIFYDINYLPNINLPRFTSRNLENKSLFDILRTAYNIEIKGGEQKIRAIGSDEKVAGYLEIPRGEPVLHLERKFETSRAGFYVYSSIFCNTSSQAVYGVF
jgi:GntR family transcriptional regulator/GntR family frlABCD operon transcriptional regulator